MKKVLFFVIVLLSLVGTYYFGVDGITGSVTSVDSMVGSVGEIEVVFCPGDCEERFVSFLSSASSSIDCALFDIGLESVQDVLLEKSSAIPVRVVTDDHYLKKFNYSFVKPDRSGLMHNKFCIIDGVKVSTGSMNPTLNGAHKNNNNLVFVSSEAFVANFQDEFDELWDGTFKKGATVRSPAVKVGDVVTKTYFCPEDNCGERVKEVLKSAEREIYFMTFSFTHDEIGNVLLLKHLDDVLIRGVMEARQVSKYSEFERLKFQGVDVVKDGNKNNMHHKVFIVDNRTVITGSFNPSANGDKRNDENIVVIYSEEIARLYLDEFERVYS